MNSGIYQIRNTVNGKRYIGSAIDLDNRKATHLYGLRRNKSGNRHLQNAFNKYGEDTFIFEILMYCLPEYCIQCEQYYLDEWKPEYNIRIIAKNNLGLRHSDEIKKRMSGRKSPMLGKHLSEETKLKLSKANSGKNSYFWGKKGKAHPQWGRPMSDEAKKKISEAMRKENNPFWGKQHSEKSLQKMSKSHSGVKLSKEHRRKISAALSSRQRKPYEPGAISPNGYDLYYPEHCLARKDGQLSLKNLEKWQKEMGLGE